MQQSPSREKCRCLRVDHIVRQRTLHIAGNECAVGAARIEGEQEAITHILLGKGAETLAGLGTHNTACELGCDFYPQWCRSPKGTP